MLQEIIVISIGIITAACIGRRTYRLLCGKKRGSKGCAGCTADCALKRR